MVFEKITVGSIRLYSFLLLLFPPSSLPFFSLSSPPLSLSLFPCL
jgi:hypothetical protein